MLKMLKDALQFINDHPRIILLLAWPVFTLGVIGLVWIIWQGPWLVSAAMQMKQLDILGGITFGVLAIIGMNQLAQSSSFFGKVGMKIGSVFDMSADMDPDPAKQTETTTVVSKTVVETPLPIPVEENV
jgi:Trk-type K+ transport system membrane component